MACGHCGRRFGDLSALESHQKAKNHCYCRECNRFFAHADGAEQHRLALHSFKCFDCNRNFVRPEALQQHQMSTKHCYCAQCDRSFVNPEALGQHLQSSVHATQFHCYDCDRDFVNEQALHQHLQSSIHATQFHCCDCDRDFVNEQALHQHLADKIHKPNAKSKASSLGLSDWVCEDCDRDFKDEKGLEQHRSSVIHKPLSDFKCFGHEHCKKRFTSPSAWLHHLESGACRSKITMGGLNTAVQTSDIHQHITGGRDQVYTALKGPIVSGNTSPEGSIILTPVTGNSFDEDLYWPTSPGSESGMLTPYSKGSRRPSDSSSPALRLLCPLCPIGRKPFKSLEALSNHLSSPAHSPKIFHCPLALAGYEDEEKVSQLMKYFSTLSGLLQHLESGACQGGNITFRKTVEYIEHNLRRLGLQRLRLLN